MAAARYASPRQAARSHAGNTAEAFVEAQHDLLARAGIAWLYRVSTPMALVRRDGVLTGVHRKKSAIDYLGYDARGRVVGVETKHVASRLLKSGKHAPIAFPMSRVEPHQARILEQIYLRGGVAVLLIVVDQGRRVFAVRWDGMSTPVLYGPGGVAQQASLPEAVLERYEVQAGTLYLPLRGCS